MANNIEDGKSKSEV